MVVVAMPKSAMREWYLGSPVGVEKWLAERKILAVWTTDGGVDFVPHITTSSRRHFVEVLGLKTKVEVDTASKKIGSNPSWGKPH